VVEFPLPCFAHSAVRTFPRRQSLPGMWRGNRRRRWRDNFRWSGGRDDCAASGNPPREAKARRRRRGPLDQTSNPSGMLSSSDAIGGGRFAPGTVLEGRYRIVALAGRGGMGEVYLGRRSKTTQTVAIKFLPESLSRDAAALQTIPFRSARRAPSFPPERLPDVRCRRNRRCHVLTMEFVDGEDLASLLRRIGRLPQDKAIEVARPDLRGACGGARQRRDSPRLEAGERDVGTVRAKFV